MPSESDSGWRSRIRTGINKLFAELDGLNRTTGLARLRELVSKSNIEIGRKTLEGMYDDLFEGKKGSRGIDRMGSEDAFEVFSEKRHADAFLAIVEVMVRGDMKGETDEPVTSDIKRLIRLPSSLHGKTGFEVVPMSRDRLTSFDPFNDAVPKAFGSTLVRIACEKPAQVRLRGGDYSLKQGESEVPEFVAVHLICRKLATKAD
jgi:DNA primase small subunit